MQKNCQSISALAIFSLYNYTNQSVAAVVDYLFNGLAYLPARVRRHSAELIVQTLVDKLMHRFTENIALPDFFRTLLKLLEKIGHQLLALLL